ncbi:helix-turn-helix transcriptional regulator [Leucobacter sp. GX24907]
MTAGRIPGEQRLFSLLLALIATPQGATKRELLSSVYGYADRYERESASVALERQFERDKDQLRTLGMPIETLDSPTEPGNTQLTRYRISRERLEVPAELRFSAEELVLLRLAALAWRDGSMGEHSRRAAMRLEALGAGVDARHLGVVPKIGSVEPAAPVLQRAIDERRTVVFDYQLPGKARPLQRRVAPLRLHRADGRWHLVAWDLERDAGRVFLLSRIAGDVRRERDTFEVALLDRADEQIGELLRRGETQLADLCVRRGSTAEARLSPRSVSGEGEVAGFRTLRVGTLDYHEHALADELATYGADVEVLGPEVLRKAVRRRLATVAAQHMSADAAGEGGRRGA